MLVKLLLPIPNGGMGTLVYMDTACAESTLMLSLGLRGTVSTKVVCLGAGRGTMHIFYD